MKNIVLIIGFQFVKMLNYTVMTMQVIINKKLLILVPSQIDSLCKSVLEFIENNFYLHAFHVYHTVKIATHFF